MNIYLSTTEVLVMVVITISIVMVLTSGKQLGTSDRLFTITPVGCWGSLGSDDIPGKKLSIDSRDWTHLNEYPEIKAIPYLRDSIFTNETSRNIGDVAYLCNALGYHYFGVASEVYDRKVQNFRIIFFNQLPRQGPGPTGIGVKGVPYYQGYHQTPLVSDGKGGGGCHIYDKRKPQEKNPCCGFPCLDHAGNNIIYKDDDGNDRLAFCGAIGYHTVSDIVWSAWRIDNID